MKTASTWLTGLCAALAVAAAGLAALPAAALERAAAGSVTLRAGPPGPPSYLAPEPPPAGPSVRRAAATFQVTYIGFTAEAQAAFQRAVDVWSRRIDSPVPINVFAFFRPLEAGVLGSAGPLFIWRNFAGAPLADTWYVDALANKLAGRQLDPAADIVARFNSTLPDWHFGTGPAPSGTFDFTSVVLHELGHGLGFIGSGTVSGGVGSVRLGTLPVVFDRFTENGSGVSLLGGFPDGSAALARQLRAGRLYFDSPAVRAANSFKRAKLYAPATFLPGSSYSHLDEALYGRGDPNSLMTPFLGPAETIRRPGRIALAILQTFGW